MNYTDLTDAQFRQAAWEEKQKNDVRHKENLARMDSFEKQLNALTDDLKKNSEMTTSIKADTQQIVTLFKASQLGATIIKWCATVGGGAIVAYAAFKGLAGH